MVLHVALEVDSAETMLQSGRRVPVASLAPLLSGEDPPPDLSTDSPWGVLEDRGYPRPNSDQGMGDLLDRAGDERFLSKSAGFRALAGEQDPQQTLYEGLLEGLGYHQNRQPFLKLASRAPYQALERSAWALGPKERAQAIQDWPSRLSGLPVPEEAELMPLPRVGFGRPLSAREWHCFRVRPSNHPLHRIAGASRLLDRFLGPGLVAGLRRVADAASPGGLTAALAVTGGDGSGVAYVGRGRARDLAVNVVLPFLHGLPTKLMNQWKAGSTWSSIGASASSRPTS